MKTGDYFKLVGGHEGALWTGRKWERFECETCVRARGLAKFRLQGPMTDKAYATVQKGPVLHRHDKDLHQQFLQASRLCST